MSSSSYCFLSLTLASVRVHVSTLQNVDATVSKLRNPFGVVIWYSAVFPDVVSLIPTTFQEIRMEHILCSFLPMVASLMGFRSSYSNTSVNALCLAIRSTVTRYEAHLRKIDLI